MLITIFDFIGLLSVNRICKYCLSFDQSQTLLTGDIDYEKGNNNMNQKQRSAFITIVGVPNVGKSSILNRILGHKIAIVSSKPQTTRTRITGILTDGEDQLVFIDTPGLLKPRNELGEYMVKAINESVPNGDDPRHQQDRHAEKQKGRADGSDPLLQRAV